ncbi:MAG: hypothetical protein IKK05_07055 [Alistipes sp.]|nr:hypothetical protein [Alistipes sp.]
MRRVVISMLAAAALLAGCSKEEGVSKADSTITIKADMGFDEATRTTIVEGANGNFLARWTEDDRYLVSLLCIENDPDDNGSLGMVVATGIELINEGEKATFEFTMSSDFDADNFIFVGMNSFPAHGLSKSMIIYQLKNEQAQDWLGYYDAQADLFVSKPIEAERPTDDARMNFTMTRLNALLELSFKNLVLDDEDKVISVTFSCEHPLAGLISFNLSDLDGVTYPIPYTLMDDGINSITLTGVHKAPYYISTLPATLKAGEEYTITVETQMATYTKSSTLPSDLELKMGEITRVTANMATATKVVK